MVTLASTGPVGRCQFIVASKAAMPTQSGRSIRLLLKHPVSGQGTAISSRWAGTGSRRTAVAAATWTEGFSSSISIASCGKRLRSPDEPRLRAANARNEGS